MSESKQMFLNNKRTRDEDNDSKVSFSKNYLDNYYQI